MFPHDLDFSACPFIQTLRRFFCFSQLSSLHLLRAMQLRNDTISFIHGFAIPPSFFGFMYKFPAFLPIAHSKIKKNTNWKKTEARKQKTGINTKSHRTEPNKPCILKYSHLSTTESSSNHIYELKNILIIQIHQTQHLNYISEYSMVLMNKQQMKLVEYIYNVLLTLPKLITSPSKHHCRVWSITNKRIIARNQIKISCI